MRMLQGVEVDACAHSVGFYSFIAA